MQMFRSGRTGESVYGSENTEAEGNMIPILSFLGKSKGVVAEESITALVASRMISVIKIISALETNLLNYLFAPLKEGYDGLFPRFRLIRFLHLACVSCSIHWFKVSIRTLQLGRLKKTPSAPTKCVKVITVCLFQANVEYLQQNPVSC